MNINAPSSNETLHPFPRPYPPQPLQPPIAPILFILAMRSKYARFNFTGEHSRPRVFRRALSPFSLLPH
jgi:hypothetical protein